MIFILVGIMLFVIFLGPLALGMLVIVLGWFVKFAFFISSPGALLVIIGLFVFGSIYYDRTKERFERDHPPRPHRVRQTRGAP